MENYKDIDYSGTDSASNAVSNGFVLEIAALSKNDKLRIPISEITLNAEVLRKATDYQVEPVIKSTQIEQPSLKPVDEPKLTSPQPLSSIAATTGKVTDSAIAPAIQIPGQPASITNTAITNNITNAKSESADNSNNIVNLTKVLKDSILEKTASSTSVSDSTSKMLETLMGVPNSVSKDEIPAINQNSKILTSVNKIKESINSKISNILKSTVDNQSTSTKEDEQTKINESMLNTLLGIPSTSEKNTITDKTTTTETNTKNSVNVKSNKLVESASVKKLLEPDKTLENSVGKLSKDLPAAVNNLSSSVTSMNPQTSSSSSVTNEGTKIDQSSKTVINQMAGQTNQPEQISQPKNLAQSPQSSDFYIQGIYAALMSGKIKVKLEYQ